MTGIQWPRTARIAAIALYAIATVLVGFGHAEERWAPAAAATAPSIDLDDYRLPDGSLPVLCLSEDGEGEGDGRRHVLCDACLVSSGHAPAPSSPTAAPASVGHRESRPAIDRAVLARTVCPANRARGPPVPARA